MKEFVLSKTSTLRMEGTSRRKTTQEAAAVNLKDNVSKN